ncbi:hypothetical protein P43SY_009320 [Pythium insidiosum]|uniref:Uncharacterized protein n=1 Tax=Pythium insidiosum TaxID=114742 RepID=A0AAD5Q830_PYTIN|nr:hypothetical protein P43SY_009320 [Pythium insidiosum]
MAELDSLGGKRKYKENPLTAQAENGSLKIKILRKDEKRRIAASYGAAVPSSPVASGPQLAAPRVPAAAAMTSPPKPRPNRKHVPIFYQRPNAFEFSASSSTDESATQSTSVTSDYDYNGSTASTASTTEPFSRLNLGSSQALEPPPPTNPLFMRGTSQNGAGSIDNLLRHVFPTLAPGSSQDFGHIPMGPSLPVSEARAFPQGSSAMPHLPLPHHHPAAALHQLASSSTAYDSRRRDFGGKPSIPSSFPYRFDPMTALQDAVKMATATATTSPSSPASSPQQSHYGQGHAAPQDDGDLGPPPMAPPAFGVQHSLVGGGIEAQPVIANVNTRSFDWNKHQDAGRPRSGSLPEAFPSDESEVNEHGHPPVHMWKEV